jgi:hypothetical protein
MTTSLAVEGVDRLAAAAGEFPIASDRLPPPWRAAAAATRAAWGVAADRPLLATGHQATLWHPGILAKALMLDRLCARRGAAPLRLLVDQDQHPIGPIEYPTLRAANGGSDLGVGRCGLDEPDAAAPTGRRRPLQPAGNAPRDAALPAVAAGVAAIVAALARRTAAPSAALQVDAALSELAAPWLAAAPVVAATDLLATPLGDLALEAIAIDPVACALRFNAALRAVPRVARPLAITATEVETPLWRLPRMGAPRERVMLDRSHPPDARRAHLHREATATPSRLAPRGLLLTALLRIACDGFIHGRGGWKYDRVSETWFGEWLGLELAPMALVSADLRLPLAVPDATTAIDDRRRWHDPFYEASEEAGEEAGPSPTRTKGRLLAQIAALPRRSPARGAAFAALQRALSRERSQRGLADPALLPRRPDAAKIAARRDWAFPLYPPPMLAALATEIDEAVA